MNKNIIFSLASFVISFNCIGQVTEQENTKASTDTFVKADILAEYRGGMNEFYKYLSFSLRYPPDAIANKVEGKNYIQFVVDDSGQIIRESVIVLKGLSESCDKEAIRVIKNSPRWKPGYSNLLQKNVPVKMVVPITFKL